MSGYGPVILPFPLSCWSEYMFTVPLFSSGSGESGKSTIVKQMKIIHQNGYSRDELIAFRPLIWKNLLESARDVVQALRKFNLEPITPANKVGRPANLLYRIVLPHSVFHRQIVNVS